MDRCWAPNDTIMQWLWLSFHMELFPHPFQTCKRFLTNNICSWWGYGAPTMLLPPYLWDQIWKVSWNHGSLLGVKWYHHAVVEALIPHGMILTSILYMSIVNGVMEPQSCCYHHTCGTGFRKSADIMDHCWVSNDTIMQCFPHPFQTYVMWLTNIICSW